MLEINIPGFKDLKINYLVCDYNGTIAFDGSLITGVKEHLIKLAHDINVHVITADTFGKVAKEMAHLPITLTIIPLGDEYYSQAQAKLDFINQLGAEHVVAIGNGCNDHLMLQAAGLGVGVIQKEGGAVKSLMSADLICTSVLDALDLLRNDKRLIATLRS